MKLLDNWKAKRAERRAFKKLEQDNEKRKALRVTAIQAVQFTDADNAEELIRRAEAVVRYIEEGR
jgi:hypothetical protein